MISDMMRLVFVSEVTKVKAAFVHFDTEELDSMPDEFASTAVSLMRETLSAAALKRVSRFCMRVAMALEGIDHE